MMLAYILCNNLLVASVCMWENIKYPDLYLGFLILLVNCYHFNQNNKVEVERLKLEQERKKNSH